MEDQLKIKSLEVTNEQQDIVDCIYDCQPNDIVVTQAYAGTGKTTTLKYCCEKWTDKNILVFAFNRSAVKLLQELFVDCPHVTIKGFHQLAYQNIPDIECCDKLKNNVIKKLCPGVDTMEKLNHVKQSFERFCYSNLEQSDNHNVMTLFNEMVSGNIPYTHDAYLKKYQLKKVKLKYDVILVDESQDCNDCMADIVMSQTEAFRVFVGDIYQNIYSFRNQEHSKIMRQLYFERTDIIKKYLSVSFRYSGVFGMMVNEFLKSNMKSNKILNTIGKHNTQIHEFTRYSLLPLGTTIVCRHNKNVHAIMFEMSQTDRTFNIIRNGKPIDFDEEIHILKDLYHLDRGELTEITHPKLIGFTDFYQVSIAYKYTGKWLSRCNIHAQYPENCWEKAKEMYTKDDPEYTITNTHQAKGMEFDKVAVASDFDFQSEEARNLFYTAITRVKKDVYIMKNMYEKEFMKPEIFKNLSV